MGYLHDGHISLVSRSKKQNDITIVSIYVNPLQFGPSEDFACYPRNLIKDRMLASAAGADYIFYPSNLYVKDHLTFINLERVADTLEGSFRPGHFQGVATVVSKLFNIVKPHTAYFGQKDAQQAYILKKMANDLNYDIKIKVLPVIRDRNGMALSSRNVFLDADSYSAGLQLSKALLLGKKICCENKNIKVKYLLKKLYCYLEKFEKIKVDYIAVRNKKTFVEPVTAEKGAIILIAARVGKVRLIDNIEV